MVIAISSPPMIAAVQPECGHRAWMHSKAWAALISVPWALIYMHGLKKVFYIHLQQGNKYVIRITKILAKRVSRRSFPSGLHQDLPVVDDELSGKLIKIRWNSPMQVQQWMVWWDQNYMAIAMTLGKNSYNDNVQYPWYTEGLPS